MFQSHPGLRFELNACQHRDVFAIAIGDNLDRHLPLALCFLGGINVAHAADPKWIQQAIAINAQAAPHSLE